MKIDKVLLISIFGVTAIYILNQFRKQIFRKRLQLSSQQQARKMQLLKKLNLGGSPLLVRNAYIQTLMKDQVFDFFETFANQVQSLIVFKISSLGTMYLGYMHGGLHCILFDYSLEIIKNIYKTSKQTNEIQYLKPISQDQIYYVQSQFVKFEGSKLVFEQQITDLNDVVYAKAKSMLLKE